MNFQIRFFFLLSLSFSLCVLNAQGQKINASSLKDLDKSKIEDYQNPNSGIGRFFGASSKSRIENNELESFLKQYPNFSSFEENIRLFYSQRKMAFAWFDQKGLVEQAYNLSNRILNFPLKNPNDIPYKKILESLIEEHQSLKSTNPQKVSLELMLTAQYCVLSEIMATGKYPNLLSDINWKPKGQKLTFDKYVDEIIKTTPSQLNKQESPFLGQYEQLKKFLKVYNYLDKTSDFFKIKLEKTSYKLGDSSEVVKLIKKRLIDLGDFNEKNPSDVFDVQLENAVKQFQKRHGLLDDGIVGKGTLAELNVSYKQRIKQLIVNMERFRWVPENQDSDYIVVNIPDFKLHVFSRNQFQWSCKVVVGKVMNKTVVFNSDLKYVVFSPYWNVPKSIVKNEILKDIRKDRHYLQKNHMEITGYRDGLPEIRQKPGPTNALGKVKFLFPNSYNIYLHDTPSKSLFDQPVRAFSHGCIRVSEPFKLAQFLLRNQPEWNDSAIESAMDAGKEKYVNLTDKVSVFIVYFTTFVDSEGKINFRKDIYGRDERLAEMILD